MGRPKLTRSHYQDNWTKYSRKRPKYTVEQFDAEKNQCRICGGTNFHHELQRATNYKYQTYGYKTHRVLWRIKCGNAKCYEPYGVILKPEQWDSAGE
jgi:hypothetical protein